MIILERDTRNTGNEFDGIMADEGEVSVLLVEKSNSSSSSVPALVEQTNVKPEGATANKRGNLPAGVAPIKAE